MSWRVAPVVLAVALAACRDQGLAALETTRDRVCKCTDAACVNAALDALEDKPTRHQRRAEGVAREITDCIARVYQTTDARGPEDEVDAGAAGAGDAAPATAP
jgi:hypothetical protein